MLVSSTRTVTLRPSPDSSTYTSRCWPCSAMSLGCCELLCHPRPTYPLMTASRTEPLAALTCSFRTTDVGAEVLMPFLPHAYRESVVSSVPIGVTARASRSNESSSRFWSGSRVEPRNTRNAATARHPVRKANAPSASHGDRRPLSVRCGDPDSCVACISRRPRVRDLSSNVGSDRYAYWAGAKA